MIQKITISQSGRKQQIAQVTVWHRSWVSQIYCPTSANTFCYLVIIMNNYVYTFLWKTIITISDWAQNRRFGRGQCEATPGWHKPAVRPWQTSFILYYCEHFYNYCFMIYHIPTSESVENSRFGRWWCEATPVPLRCVGITSSVHKLFGCFFVVRPENSTRTLCSLLLVRYPRPG